VKALTRKNDLLRAVPVKRLALSASVHARRKPDHRQFGGAV
jgi:hypothetical protein